MENASANLFWIPLLPLIGAAINLIFGRWLSRRTVYVVSCTAVGSAFLFFAIDVAPTLWDLFQAHKDAGGTGPRPQVVDHVYSWIASGDLRIDLRFVIDPLAGLMVFTVTFVGFLIHVYSTGYMDHERRYASYFGYLNLFTGAMLILVLGDSLPVMFIGWEGVGLCSYLLIGFWFDKEANANAGRKAFIVNRIGDFAFLLGIFLLFWGTSGSVDFAGLEGKVATLSAPLPGSGGQPLAFWAGLLLFIGACGKSAQIPLYVWLPDAMAGPTPVSALIHAATMVTAGVYMVARLNFLYMAAPAVMMIVAGIGAATAIFAAIIGFAQTDMKKVLAYSTVSQLGFMFVGVGTGNFTAGIFHLFTHAFFKAGLFLGAGSVMHAMSGSGDIMIMGGLRKKLPITHATFLIYCLAIAGIVPFAGFFSKDEVLLGAWIAHLPHWPAWYGKLLWGVLSLAALGTAFYMWRLYFLVFWGENRADEETKKHIHESPASMTGPLVVLALGAIALGFLGLPHTLGLPSFIGSWLSPSLSAAPELHASSGLTLGLMAAALISAVIGIGIAWKLYANGPEGAAGVVRSLGGLKKVVANKFYVDEIYDFLLVRPFRYLARALFNVVDRFVIDLVLVNGWGFLVGTAGRLARTWQNGDVQRYLWAMVVGAVVIFWYSTDLSPELHATTSGTTATFVADLGAGPIVQAAKIEWDVDGDGKVDHQYDGQREVTRDFGAPGKYEVSVWVTDSLFGDKEKVTTSVTTGGAP